MKTMDERHRLRRRRHKKHDCAGTKQGIRKKGSICIVKAVESEDRGVKEKGQSEDLNVLNRFIS